jgi:hypothetical protein
VSAWSSASWFHLTEGVAELERRVVALRQDMQSLVPDGLPPDELRRRLGDEEGGIERAIAPLWGPVWWESEPCHTSD